MISDDERREVAKRLRKAKSECKERGYPWMVEDLLEALGFEKYEDCEDGIFDRLSDLIDPTCEMEAAGDVPAPVKDSLETFFCSECGSPIYNDINPSYCLYCGHRSVNER